MVPWERQDPDSEYISPRRPPLRPTPHMAEFIDTKLSFGHSPSRSRARADESCPPRQPNKRSLLVRPYRPGSARALSRSSPAPPAAFRPAVVFATDRSAGGGKLRRKFREPVVHTTARVRVQRSRRTRTPSFCASEQRSDSLPRRKGKIIQFDAELNLARFQLFVSFDRSVQLTLIVFDGKPVPPIDLEKDFLHEEKTAV